MRLSRFLPHLPARSAPSSAPESRPAATTAPIASASSPAEPTTGKRLMSRFRPAWTGGLAAKLQFKEKASPPIALSGATWMKQYTEQQRVAIQPGMSGAALYGAVIRNSYMRHHELMQLSRDIDAVLATYSGGNQALQKAVDKYFRATYAILFQQNFYTFGDESQRKLMQALSATIKDRAATSELAASAAAATSVASVASVAPITPIAFPGFSRVATKLAFDLILNAHLDRVQDAHDTPTVRVPEPMPPATSPEPPRTNRLQRIRNVFRGGATPPASIQSNLKRLRPGTFIHSQVTNKAPLRMPATQPSASTDPGAQSAEAQQLRADEAIHQAVAGMAPGNARFSQWLGDNNIEAVANSGYGLNCLIIALLQHATGAYENASDGELAARARQLRDELGIEPGMLYSDDATASRIVDAINRQYSTNMIPVEVQADEAGRPVIPALPDELPEGDRVVIWQQGNHFEALRVRDGQEAS